MKMTFKIVFNEWSEGYLRQHRHYVDSFDKAVEFVRKHYSGNAKIYDELGQIIYQHETRWETYN